MCERLVKKHKNDNVLIIGQYSNSFKCYLSILVPPIITGQTPNKKREELYAAFRTGECKLLIVSKVANFAIDLPDANIRLRFRALLDRGRKRRSVLAAFCGPNRTALSRTSIRWFRATPADQDYSVKRQLFLTEQGYRYEIKNADELNPQAPAATESA